MIEGSVRVAPVEWHGSAGAFSLWVPGTPRPQGSKTYYNGRGVESSKYVKGWRADVRAAAAEVWHDPPLDAHPLQASYSFRFRRPNSHYVAGDRSRPLKPSAPHWMSSAPDVSKLVRAIEDALTGIVIADDRLIASSSEQKLYSGSAGVLICLDRL